MQVLRMLDAAVLSAAILCAQTPITRSSKSAAGAESITRLDGTRVKPQEVDRIVADLMRKAHVPGLALAVLNHSEIVYLKAFGLRSVERNEPLSVNSVMCGASLTKAAFAYMVMQLVDEKLIDLDKPVTEYLSKPLAKFPKYADLASDERYKQITARMLLSHSAGFPNFRFLNENGKLDIKFEPGTRYAYSGEGINLLGFVVEQITGQSVADLMRTRVFERFGMVRTSLSWEPRFAVDYADGYDAQGKLIAHSRRVNPRAAGSMDTTVSDYAKFLRGVLRGAGIKAASREQMFKAQIRIHSKQQFPTLAPETTTDNDGIQLSYGLGWGLFWSPYGKAFFKEGHDEGTENHAVCFDQRKTCLLVLTNSSNGDSLFQDLLGSVLAERSTPWHWENYTPFPR